MWKNSWFIISCLMVCAACSHQAASSKLPALAQAWDEFSNPGDSTRTKVWWFHGETETTREGITADLEAYKRAGVGGVVYYDQVHGDGENALPAFSSEWWEMLRYYSGTAIYRKTIELEQPKSNEQVFLRFSNINFMGRIRLNGQEISTVWCSPWEADLTPAILQGENKLEIEVVNSLMNRMIGDAGLPQEKRYTFAYPEIVKPADNLVPSGMMDEVLLVHRVNN